MSRGSWPWSVLGIDRTDDLKLVRKAYADKLKAMDLDRDAAAYAMLRNARDAALAMAKAGSAAPAVSDDEWSVAAAIHEPEEGEDEDYEDSVYFNLAPDIEPEFYHSAEPPPLESTNSGPDRELNALLFPDGEQSDEAMDETEETAAREALRRIVADAQEGDLGRQQMVDYWIADRLASAWPRSAPLVAEAAEAFEWEQRHGQLGEGPAQAFITARLKGMRFHQAVQQPGHWGYRAWQELSSPGKRKWWQRSRAGKDEVQQLVGHIRENYPELESLLDWEKIADHTQPVGNPWSWVGRIVVGLIIVSQVLRFCSAAVDSTDGPEYREETEAAWTQGDRDALAADLFGPATTYDIVAMEMPELAQMIERVGRMQQSAPDTSFLMNSMIVGQVRMMVLNADRTADFDQLLRIKQLKLKLLELAWSARGAAACARFARGAALSATVEVPETLRNDERRLAGELFGDGKLEYRAVRPAMSAPVPGALFAAAEAASGISGEAAGKAAKGEGPGREICLFHKALLAEALRRPGNLSRELLLIL